MASSTSTAADTGTPMRNRTSPRFTGVGSLDRKSTRLNSSHLVISYAVFCLKKKKKGARRADNHPSDREHRQTRRDRNIRVIDGHSDCDEPGADCRDWRTCTHVED